MDLNLADENAIEEMRRLQAEVTLVANLGRTFVATDDYKLFRSQFFRVLELREAQLKAGIFEQKGVALLGPAGAGKSRIVDEVIKEYVNLAEATGGREFGSRILSIIVPGAASVKDTCGAILLELGYDIQSNRDENYLWRLVKTQMKLEKAQPFILTKFKIVGDSRQVRAWRTSQSIFAI